MNSAADAPLFQCPTCDAATPHTFRIHSYGDKSDGWVCKSCGIPNKRTLANTGKAFKFLGIRAT
jgi:predicted nucleic acid-binding Zn ribbon protein